MLRKNIHYKEITVGKWFDLHRHAESLQSEGGRKEWIFRGQKNSDFLQTTLEKAISNAAGVCRKDSAEAYVKCLRNTLEAGIEGRDANDIEDGLIRKFQRQYYLYDIRIPHKGDVIEWLSLMRHYGAPTRLLDWTYSFYIAVFFAIEERIEDCAVWALEKSSVVSNLPKEIRELLRRNRDEIESSTWERRFKGNGLIPFVYPVNPFRLNERLVIQQGDFLCPADISKPFEDNFVAVLPKKQDMSLRKYVLDFTPAERRKALLGLQRMNINRASLFPGLEGFATAMKTLLFSPNDLLDRSV